MDKYIGAVMNQIYYQVSGFTEIPLPLPGQLNPNLNDI